MTILNTNVAELQAALDLWLGYKGDLEMQRRLQARQTEGSGFTVKQTQMSEFKARIDGASRRAMAALGTDNMMELESLGEILLNAVANSRQQERDPTYKW